jgi:hypothetical protein
MIEEIRARRRENDAEVPQAFEVRKLITTTRIENRKLWVSPIITIILTIGSGLISLGVASILKNNELRSANISDATKTIINYKVQLDTVAPNNYKQRLFLSNIIAAYPNYDDSTIIKLQRESRAISLRQDSIAALTKSLAETASPAAEKTVNPAAKKGLDASDKAEIDLQNAKQNGGSNSQITKLENDVAQNRQVVNILPDSLKQAVADVGSVNAKILQQLKSLAPANQNNNVVKDYGVSWFKEGYFLLFDSLKITLMNIDRENKMITVEVCRIENGTSCDPAHTSGRKIIDLNGALPFEYGKNKFNIYLRSIDHAGHNPFTWAAYINVVKVAND